MSSNMMRPSKYLLATIYLRCHNALIQTGYLVMEKQHAKLDALKLDNNCVIGYKKYVSKTSCSPGLIFCPGFLSSLDGKKASFLHDYCLNRDISYVRFDYTGRGSSSGSKEDFTIGLWRQNAIDVLDKLTDGLQVVVGSSMGGWIALLLALARPKQVHAVVTIACAADFMLKRYANLSPEMQVECQNQGYVYFESHLQQNSVKIPVSVLNEAAQHCVLDRPIAIKSPVRLIHGMADDVIPYKNSLDVADLLESKDVQVLLEKDGDHSMCDEKNLRLLAQVLDAIFTATK